MPRYEYKLVPAPDRATRHKGLKGAASFAATLEEILNDLGREGWHYLRADTLPQEERSGLTSRTTSYRNLLVFQRELPDVAEPPAEPVLAIAQHDVAQPTPEGSASTPGPLLPADPPPADPITPEKPVPRFARRPLVADRKAEGRGD